MNESPVKMFTTLHAYYEGSTLAQKGTVLSLK